ncbi:MAG: hypothetical protein FJW86_10220 [Actinobacteria bacterium]|nr:hypothetical protein [Actinomycetota bacterium]
MRKPLVIIAAIAAAGALGVPAVASTAAKKKPVKLEGDVVNKGIGKVVDGAVEIDADDFFFKKTFIKGTAGETVSVTVENTGDVEHTFTIEDQDIDENLAVGDSVTVQVEIAANGKPVTGFCRLHRGSGMQFAFFTKSGGKASSEDRSKEQPDDTTDDSDDSGGGSFGY